MRRVRGRWLQLMKHAYQGMEQERPPITIDELLWLFEEPDHDDGNEVRKRLRGKTIRAYYSTDDENIWVRGVSCTTGDRV